MEARGKALRAIAERLESQREPLGQLMAREMGKPLAQGVGEAEKCAWVCRYYADYAATFLSPETIEADASRSLVRCDPLGTILAIMPWNFPLWQLFRFAAPALMAGNAVALKHAPNVPGCALAIESLCREAGLPEGLLVNLFAEHDQIAAIIATDSVAAVSFTGSTRAGAIVAELAGRNLKKCVLELGGSDPFVVLADGDIEAAARAGSASRLLNSGQSCIAAKRFIVEEAAADAFLGHLQAELEQAVLGEPLEPSTTIGPLARADLRDALHEQVQQSVQAGARCRMGGFIPKQPGWYYPVTLLTEVGPGMAAWEEELFGPVAAVRVVADADAALRAANDTSYGLGAAVYTSDTDRIAAWSAALEAGAVFFNGMVKSDPRLPFGGIKRSGFGRELGAQGIREFVNEKTVWIA
jgi:succinate-semialdehyde dehydrogenase/glutarate-semialdehyde dehydrogenase